MFPKAKYLKSENSFKNLVIIVSKMVKNLDFQGDTKLAYEVQKYKCMYDEAYKQHLFSLSRRLSFTQT